MYCFWPQVLDLNLDKYTKLTVILVRRVIRAIVVFILTMQRK